MCKLLGFVLCAVCLAACRSTSPTVAIVDPGVPPLPSASGTPIGLLIDEAQALQLRDDQLASLHEIDATLSTRNDAIEAQLRALERPPEQPDRPGGHGPGGGGMRAGMSAGGMSMGGGGGGMGPPPGGGGGGPGGGRGKPPGGPPQGAPADPAASQRLDEQRAANVHDALERAFAVLDADQRITARKLLDDRGGGEGSRPGPGRPPGSFGEPATPVERR